MLRANLYLDLLADRKNEVQRRRRKKNGIGKRRGDTRASMCAMSCTLIFGSFLHPPPLACPILPSYAKPTLLLMSPLTRTEVRPYLLVSENRRAKPKIKIKGKQRDRELTILRDTGEYLRQR